MSEIFISYKSERRLAAEHFAEVLKRYGYSVWFDYELVKGKDFTQQIERRVREAKALVVLWCSHSVSSRWVREEVYLADKLGILIPVMIEPCEIPFGFQLADTIDLTQWDGAPRSHQLDPLIDALEGRIGRAAAQDRRGLIEYEATWRRFGAPVLRSFALGQPVENGADFHPPMSKPVETQSAKPLPQPIAQPAPTYENKAQRLIRTFTGRMYGVNSAAFSPDGCTAFSGSDDDTVNLKLWDVGSGRELRSFAGHSYCVSSVAISPDGRKALSGSVDRTLKLWDLISGRELRCFTGHTRSVSSVALSPDGRAALSGGGSADYSELVLWDVASDRELRWFTGHTRNVSSVAFSPDGRTALSGSWDTSVKLWDIASGRELHTFAGHRDWLNSVAFSPDGRTALSSGHDQTLKLWDLTSGRELRCYTGHASVVSSVAFSPDGRTALSGSWDKTLKLWHIASGRELHTFTDHTDYVNSVAFSPNGRTALSGSNDETLKLWDLTGLV